MFGIGMPEMFLLLAVALVVIGPKKLPDLAKSLGRALGEFRKATSDLKESMVEKSDIEGVKNTFEDLKDDINTPLDINAFTDSDKTADNTRKEKTTPTEDTPEPDTHG